MASSGGASSVVGDGVTMTEKRNLYLYLYLYPPPTAPALASDSLELAPCPTHSYSYSYSLRVCRVTCFVRGDEPQSCIEMSMRVRCT